MTAMSDVGLGWLSDEIVDTELIAWPAEWSSGSDGESIDSMQSRLLSESDSLIGDNLSVLGDDALFNENMLSSSVEPKIEQLDEAVHSDGVTSPAPKRSKGERKVLGTRKSGGARKTTASRKPVVPLTKTGSFFEILTEEERGLMEAEGIKVPPHGPLSKVAERELKRLRRQVKNKYSAKDSRKKHKEYIDGLQQINADLTDKLNSVQREADALRSHLRSVQSALRPPAGKSSSRARVDARKSAMVLVCLLFSPYRNNMDLTTASKDIADRANLTSSSSMHGLFPMERNQLDAALKTEPFGEDDADDAINGVADGDDVTPLSSSDDVAMAMLTDSQSEGVINAARRAVADYLHVHPDTGISTLSPHDSASALSLGLCRAAVM